jgi:hypothetical protein
LTSKVLSAIFVGSENGITIIGFSLNKYNFTECRLC